VHGKRPLHPGDGAERAGKPWTWVRRGKIWYLIRLLCVADFPNLGNPTITGPHGLPGVLFRCFETHPGRAENQNKAALERYLASIAYTTKTDNSPFIRAWR
jgi:hypothetical protein